MVWIHQGCVGLASLTMASVYCTKRHGICRPTPMYFYLMDSWQEIKFERDPVSIALVSFFILTVSALQIGIEVKKRKLLNETKKAEKAAEDAKRNLDEARLKLSMSEVMKHEADENGDSNLGPPALENDDLRNSNVIQISHSDVGSDDNDVVTTSKNELKVTRIVTLLAVVPASTFAVAFSMEGVDHWRPHGPTVLVMVAFGDNNYKTSFCQISFKGVCCSQTMI